MKLKLGKQVHPHVTEIDDDRECEMFMEAYGFWSHAKERRESKPDESFTILTAIPGTGEMVSIKYFNKIGDSGWMVHVIQAEGIFDLAVLKLIANLVPKNVTSTGWGEGQSIGKN